MEVSGCFENSSQIQSIERVWYSSKMVRISSHRRCFWSLLVTVAVLSLQISPTFGRSWPSPARGKHGMVASQHELASRIGVDIMKRGGNAVDAAIAVGVALAVVYPEAGNIGGGGFMLIRMADGTTTSVDYREKAPADATRDMYLKDATSLLTGEGSSTVGYRASGVPGTIAGFEYAYKHYGSGKIKWAELIRPSREIAARGYTISDRVAGLLKAYEPTLSQYADSKQIFLNGGKMLGEGDTLVQTDLSKTLLRIERSGAAGFYSGETARLIADDMKANGGLITLQDLKNYNAVERKPLIGTYRGNTVIGMGPPSSGGIVTLEVLNMLERFDLASLGYNSAARYHLFAEAERRAFADRGLYFGDADFSEFPVAHFIDKNYAIERAKTISADTATPSTSVKGGLDNVKEGTETTHFTVIDQAGNVVTNTFTLNDLFGSRVTAKGTGVLLNDEMDDFASRPGSPNMFGLQQGENNSIKGGKRPLSSMSPTVVLRKDGTFWFALGARGGPIIISAVLQSLLNVVDNGMNIQEAIDAPRVHHQWLPDLLFYEPYGLSPDTRRILEKQGHKFVEKPMVLASATGVMVDEKGVRFGAVDSRSDGAAIGY